MDIQKRLEQDIPESAEYTHLKIAFKVVHVQVQILQAFVKAGGYSMQLVKALDEADHFLSMSPYTTSLAHPPWLLTRRHEMHAVAAPSNSFWRQVDSEALLKVGFNGSYIVDVQSDIISQKVVRLGESTAEWPSALSLWHDLMSEDNRRGVEVETEIAEDLHLFGALLFWDTIADFEACRDAMASCRFVGSLKQTSSGDAFLQMVSDRLLAWEAVQELRTPKAPCAS